MVAQTWYCCPACGSRLLKVMPDSVMSNIPVWCRRCKVEWFPAIFNGVELGADDPFPLYEQNK